MDLGKRMMLWEELKRQIKELENELEHDPKYRKLGLLKAQMHDEFAPNVYFERKNCSRCGVQMAYIKLEHYRCPIFEQCTACGFTLIHNQSR